MLKSWVHVSGYMYLGTVLQLYATWINVIGATGKNINPRV